MRVSLCLLAAAGALSACSSGYQTADAPIGRPGATCILPTDVVGWSDVRRQTIHFKTRGGSVYEGLVYGGCFDAGEATQIAIRPSQSSRICEGHAAELIVAPTVNARGERCRLDNIRLLDATETAALPPSEQP